MSTGLTETVETAHPVADDAEPSRSDRRAPLRTARRAGLIQQVIEQLRARIESGDWAVGARIPTEAELAEMTATSRNTVREAVQSLVHAGLLERRQGSGTYVLAASELAGAMSRRMAAAAHRDILEVRRTLEAGAARLAALRRTDEDIARLREALATRAAFRQAGDLNGHVAADVALHLAIMRAAHNPVMAELYGHLVDALQENVRHNVAMNPPIDDGDHVDLVDAIVARQPDRAAEEAGRFLDDLLEVRPA